MVTACHPHWKRRVPSKATRELVLDALRRCGPMTAYEVAAETNKRLAWVCPTLDHLRIRGRVELGEDFRFRKVETA